MNMKFFEKLYGIKDEKSLKESGIIEEAFKEFNNGTIWNTTEATAVIEHFFERDLKLYRDTVIEFKKEGEKVIIKMFFEPDQHWSDIGASNDRQNLIESFSDTDEAEKVLTENSEEAIEAFIEMINDFYNEQLEPHRNFYNAVEEISQTYSGLAEVIVKDDPDSMFVYYINSNDIEIWRNNNLIDEDTE